MSESTATAGDGRWCPECAGGRVVRDPETHTYTPCSACTAPVTAGQARADRGEVAWVVVRVQRIGNGYGPVWGPFGTEREARDWAAAAIGESRWRVLPLRPSAAVEFPYMLADTPEEFERVRGVATRTIAAAVEVLRGETR